MFVYTPPDGASVTVSQDGQDYVCDGKTPSPIQLRYPESLVAESDWTCHRAAETVTELVESEPKAPERSLDECPQCCTRAEETEGVGNGTIYRCPACTEWFDVDGDFVVHEEQAEEQAEEQVELPWNPSGKSVRDIIAGIDDIHDSEILKALAAQEVEGDDRVGARKAFEARLRDLLDA